MNIIEASIRNFRRRPDTLAAWAVHRAQCPYCGEVVETRWPGDRRGPNVTLEICAECERGERPERH